MTRDERLGLAAADLEDFMVGSDILPSTNTIQAVLKSYDIAPSAEEFKKLKNALIAEAKRTN